MGNNILFNGSFACKSYFYIPVKILITTIQKIGERETENEVKGNQKCDMKVKFYKAWSYHWALTKVHVHVRSRVSN